MPFRAPVVLGDGDLCAGVVSVHPGTKPRDELNAVVNPALVRVVRVPERARRAVAPELHRLRGVVAELAALRVVVDAEDIQQSLARRHVLLMQLVEEPRQIVHAAVAGAVWKITPTVETTELLVEAAEEVAAPAPLFRADDRRRRVNGLDLRGVVENLVPYLLHRRARGVNVPVRRVPDARLVVEDVVAQAPVRSCAPLGREVLHPSLLERRVNRHVGLVRVVAGD